jgi:hypothetical protein
MRTPACCSAVLFAAAGLVAASCAPLPEVHPDYARLKPKTIYLRDTENHTTRGLEEVKFGGLAQRLTGLRVFNFPLLVRQQLHEVLLEKGYEVTPQAGGAAPSFGKPQAEGESGPKYDAYVESAILAWSGSTQAPYKVDMTYRLWLVHAGSGQRLYGGEFVWRAEADMRSPADTQFIHKGIERSVRKALRGLPPAD